MTAAAVTILVVMVMMLMVSMATVMLQLSQLLCNGILTFHSSQQLGSRQFCPRGRDQRRMVITLPQQGHRCVQFRLRDGIGAGQDDGRSGFDLVIVELTKVLHIDLYLAGIRHRNGITQGYIVTGDLLYRLLYVGQLTHAGWLNNDTVGMVLFYDLFQCLAEIAHQAAADTAGVHFRDVDAGILQETAIDADLAEFILNQHQLLILIGFLNHFLDQGRLASSQEAGVNVDFRH